MLGLVLRHQIKKGFFFNFRALIIIEKFPASQFNDSKEVTVWLQITSYVAGTMANVKCDITLPCGHKCSYTKQTPHWKHIRSKCKHKCSKELCSRGHICRKVCGETCGPCTQPVKLNLSCISSRRAIDSLEVLKLLTMIFIYNSTMCLEHLGSKLYSW